MNSKIAYIEKELVSLREDLKNHKLYKQLNSIDDIKTFMEGHVFAVWDFMSLLKALQINLTTVSTPWIPKKNTNLVRFINEITLAEESDVNKDGVLKSHYEMYLDAMQEMHADCSKIENFIQDISKGKDIIESLEKLSIDKAIKDFVTYTFNIIDANENHKIAAAFTFGREDIIPDMFLKIVDETTVNSNVSFDNFIYYLNRHIELDGDEHGPLSLQMIEELCGNDDKKWQEVLDVAKTSLQVRINLWTAIEETLKSKKEPVLA
ncbi:DUF3050 domain-containing protein [uncultured Polaribacter sp.]|uniref:DUF3050 domain-containing protein n=1 Tax=uncultured Polaribacter sp. TaxID=174711 RepID=UPI0026329C59|nr:DUF3050 domain-containing protein [uncultured Polaribacter sp.]